MLNACQIPPLVVSFLVVFSVSLNPIRIVVKFAGGATLQDLTASCDTKTKILLLTALFN